MINRRNALTLVLTSIAALSLTAACATKPAKTDTSTTAAPADCSRDVGAALDAALAGPQRSDKNKARDVYRHPKETLAFMGLKPTMNVVELWPGGGWYTEVIAPVVQGCGQLTAAAKSTGDAYKKKLADDAAHFGEVKAVDVDFASGAAMVPDGSADMVLTFRNIHNWIAGDMEAQVYAAAFRALKPGGVFGVEEHRARKGTDLETTKNSGYVDEDAVIERITKAGFVLEEKSEINANPKDTKDYEKGVWTLPPALTNGDVDKDKYLAIGESDRMTLRFRKPK